jgi:hypothetical protein
VFRGTHHSSRFYAMGRSARPSPQTTIRPLPSSKQTVSSPWPSLWDSKLTFVICMPPTTSVWSPPFPVEFAHENGSDALGRQADLFHQQLQISIREGRLIDMYLTLVLSALDHLDPFQAQGHRRVWLLWIADILNSGYPEDERYGWPAGGATAGEAFLSRLLIPIPLQAWIPPLLASCRCARSSTTESPPHPGSSSPSAFYHPVRDP